MGGLGGREGKKLGNKKGKNYWGGFPVSCFLVTISVYCMGFVLSTGTWQGMDTHLAVYEVHTR